MRNVIFDGANLYFVQKVAAGTCQYETNGDVKAGNECLTVPTGLDDPDTKSKNIPEFISKSVQPWGFFHVEMIYDDPNPVVPKLILDVRNFPENKFRMLKSETFISLIT